VKWIISEVFFPDEVSTALIMTEIAEEYAKDEEISVICGPGGYEKSYKTQVRALNRNIKVCRVNIGNYNKNRLLSRVIRLFVLTIKMTFTIIRKVKRHDELLMVTNPAFLLVTVALIKSFMSIKFHVLVHDIFPDNLVPAGLASREGMKFKVLNSLFNWAYRKADKLIVLGEDMGDLMVNKLGIDRAKIKVITNWADPEVMPIPDYAASDYFNIDLSGKLVIGFAGNIGRVQGVPEFIEAFVKADNAKLALVLVGDGALKAELETALQNQDVKNVHFVGSKARSEQIYFLNACDIGLITLKEGMFGLGVPSKTYNVMAAQKPLLYIGDARSEIDRYVTKFNNGWSFNWGQKDEIVSFLRDLSERERSIIENKGNNSLNAVNTFFQKSEVLKLYKHL